MKSLFGIVFFIVTNSLLALEPVIITEDKGEYPLGLYLEILEDKEGKLTIDDVQKLELQKEWVKSEKEVPNFGFSDSTYWLRFEIQNEFTITQNWVLEIGFPLIDYIDFYLLEDNGKYSLTQTGDRRPFHSRQYDNKNYLFKIPIESKKSQVIYIKTWSHDGLHESIPIVLFNNESYIKKVSSSDAVLGVYIGIILVMFLYNTFLFFSVRDITYLYYILYLLGFIGWILVYYGYAFQYFWSDSPYWANQSIALFVIFFLIMLLLYSRAFLVTSRFTPRLDGIFKFYILLFSIYIPLSFFVKYATIWKLIILIAFIAPPLALLAGVFCLRSGYRPARYYFIAWSFLSLAGMVIYLKIISVLPSNFLTENSVAIGSALEVTLLSLGLADRINSLKKEKEQAQAESLANQRSAIENLEKINQLEKENAKTLEQKVIERTAQVNEMLDQLGKMYVDSENKRKEIELLAESRKKLSFVGQMAAGIVHDIKNPMATIKYFAESLTSEDVTEESKKEYQFMILREMDRLTDLTYEILDFSKGELKLDLQELNLKDFMNEINKFLAMDFEYLGVACHLDLQYQDNIQIDKDRMRRVIVNLAKNALEAMYDGARKYSLTIRTERITNPTFSPLRKGTYDEKTHFREEKTIRISLIDNGPGIPESVQQRIFQAFATEGKAKGTGLGLFMCKWIVEAHNGTLTYETKLGVGTSFYIDLPENEIDKIFI